MRSYLTSLGSCVRRDDVVAAESLPWEEYRAYVPKNKRSFVILRSDFFYLFVTVLLECDAYSAEYLRDALA